ncbi:HPF/RaiA family ribosome-associated protein [Cognatiluteimonas weifangensis]|uniref:HPF/RaiA family ribosome-associated protein n=1 Tax=Cognatiluteimonas weifangensis TaxID=2303539 RepID=A0A372DMT5_9GAMM|nr:HPF/RaiA family ribosome-associated protein [Luteimonas weifangensis]RFP60880.1 hypothetical protein D0Y53_07015 [Luteimonas weifangensis]
MQILIHTDRTIPASDRLQQLLEAAVAAATSRFGAQITRIQAHLSDVNSDKGGVDKRCVLEARPAGLDPVVATHQAATVELAIAGAGEKLGRSLDSIAGRLASSRYDTPGNA